MFSIKPDGTVTLPRGDTILFRIRLTGGSFPPGTVGVFGICTSSGAIPVFSKVFSLEGDTVTVYLTNAETRQLDAKKYRWDVRIVTDPEYNDDGSVRCDNASDSVLSLFSGMGMPEFIVTGVAVDV